MKDCNKCKMKRLCDELSRLGYTQRCDGHDPLPITNADRIRAMTDEELAAHMVNSVTVALLRFGNMKLDGNILSGYIDYWLDWLKQEVEDG